MMRWIGFSRQRGIAVAVLLFASMWHGGDALAGGPGIQGACAAAVDSRPRIALISAYDAETDRLIEEMLRGDSGNSYSGCVVINGYRYAMGRLRGEDVVAVLTNASIVNAAMVTQLTLDRFAVSHIIFSGIAGGVGGKGANDEDSATANEAPVGTVVIPRRWGFHQESYFNQTRQTVPCAALIPLALNAALQSTAAQAESCRNALGKADAPGAANTASLFAPDDKFAFLRDTNVSSAQVPQYYLNEDDAQRLRGVPLPGTPSNPAHDQQLRFWFLADNGLFALAEQLKVTLIDCLPEGTGGECSDQRLNPAPHLVVGQNGVSGPAFVDNARYRRFLANALNFDENGRRNDDSDVLVVDMETAAAAQVAKSNGIPFIAIRGVSDLAGANHETAANELRTFFGVAAENQARTVLALLDRLNAEGAR